MAAIAQPHGEQVSQSPRSWVANFLLQEMRPYPGRAATVVRMTLAATLVMLWIMTFRIPGAGLGAYYTMLFSRDSSEATFRSALTTVLAVGSSLVFVLVGTQAAFGDPFLHFVWVCLTLFVIFFLISSLTVYNAAVAFGFLAVNAVNLWDFPARTETSLERTLWTALAVLTAATTTVVVEFVFHTVRPGEQFNSSFEERIRGVESVFRSLAVGNEPSPQVRSKIEQYATIGTALLRRILLRSFAPPADQAELSALVSIVGRLVDLTAALLAAGPQLDNDARARLRLAADALHQLDLAVASRNLPILANLTVPSTAANPESILDRIEDGIARIPEVCAGLQPLTEFAPSPGDRQKTLKLFKPDAFSSRAHLLFAFKGMLAAVSCYALYHAIDWRGLNTAIATCVITALTTVGSSRQKQILRFGGAIFGSVVIGMTAQVFVLPYLDGIGGFTVLFIAVTFLSAWIQTASPRIAYFGGQTAFAFYITHLATFGPQTSLSVARNDVCGILLGLAAMWLIFDRLWAKNAADELLDSFVRNIRRVANLENSIDRSDLRTAVNRIRIERASISDDFDLVRNDADALIFEVGRGWQQKVALRNHIRAWQPQLRAYLFLEIALFHTLPPFGAASESPEVRRQTHLSQRILLLLADLLDRRTANRNEVRAALDRALSESATATPAVPLLRTARDLAAAITLA